MMNHMKVILLLLLAAGLLVACNPCRPGQQRCNGTVVEICRPDGRWAKAQDCSKLHRTEKKFECCCKTEKSTKCFCAQENK